MQQVETVEQTVEAAQEVVAKPETEQRKPRRPRGSRGGARHRQRRENRATQMHPAKSAPRLNQSRTKPVLVPNLLKIGTMHQLPEKAESLYTRCLSLIKQ